MIVHFLVDCGATASLLHEKVYLSIPEPFRSPLQQEVIQITLADGSSQKCMGRSQITIKVAQEEHTCSFLIGQ